MMPIRFFILLLALINMVGCSPSQDKEAAPDNLLKEEKFQAVLVDVMLADAYIQEMPIPMDSQKLVLNKTYAEIFNRHEVSREAYFQTLAYYNTRPEEFFQILEPVKDTLSAMEAQRE